MRALWRPRHVPLEEIVDWTPRSVRRLSDAELHRGTASWGANTSQRLTGEIEIRRREARFGLYAIWIAAGSLVVSVIALFRP